MFFDQIIFGNFGHLFLSGLKVKNYSKINILIIKNYEINYKMDIESLQ